jgi:hypothetical protein
VEVDRVSRLQVTIREASKMIKHRKIGIKSLIPIDITLFSIIYPDLLYPEGTPRARKKKQTGMRREERALPLLV